MNDTTTNTMTGNKTGKKPGSLHWRLVRNIVALQTVALVLLLGLIVLVLSLNDLEDDGDIVDAVRGTVFRDAAGGLGFRDSPELSKFRLSHPNLWFVVRDQAGAMASSGNVPDEFKGTLAARLARPIAPP